MPPSNLNHRPANRPGAGVINMLRQYLVGAAASVFNIAIHAFVMVIVIKAARIADELATRYQTLRLIAVMSAAVMVLMIAHLAEVLVWSLTYAIFGVAPDGADIVNFDNLNNTTPALTVQPAGYSTYWQ